jgi:hypothetical protein
VFSNSGTNINPLALRDWHSVAVDAETRIANPNSNVVQDFGTCPQVNPQAVVVPQSSWWWAGDTLPRHVE